MLKMHTSLHWFSVVPDTHFYELGIVKITQIHFTVWMPEI